MQSRRKTTGFTLMEMLIVVAIIAVLIAIAIPVFTSQLASARAATCQANQRSLLGSFETIYMSDVNSTPDEQMQKAVASMGSNAELTLCPEFYTVKGLCPDGGTWTCTVKDGVLSIVCPVANHSKTKSFSQTGTMDNINSIINGIANVPENIRKGGGGFASKAEEVLAEQGVDLNEMGAASWYWRNGNGDYGNKLYWTTTEVSNDTVTTYAMSYNFITENYVVWEMNCKDGKLMSEKGSKVGPKDGEQTYEKAFALYQEKLNEQG